LNRQKSRVPSEGREPFSKRTIARGIDPGLRRERGFVWWFLWVE